MIKKVPFIVGTPTLLLYLIGPSFYLYIVLTLKNKNYLNRSDYLHLIPFLICLIAASPFYFQSNAQKLAYLNNIDPNTVNIPLKRAFYFLGHIIQTIFYLILSFRMVFHENIKPPNSNIYGKLKWIKRVYFSLMLFALIYATELVIFMFFDSYSVQWRNIFNSSISFFVIMMGFWLLKESDILTHTRFSSSLSLEDEKIQEIKNKIVSVLEDEQLYLDSKLTLGSLGKKLSINTFYISAVINKSFGKSFNELVSEYRVNYAKKILSQGNFNQMKLFAVALESGFSNKNTFNRVFKKITGNTPSEYRSLTK
ncbi:MAG: helix-turn-helix transcriptional regulator [Bacteroidetes bacterium]|nr:helix-turn-helix transcriptional regulator [Bacteroidota bacterium]